MSVNQILLMITLLVLSSDMAISQLAYAQSALDSREQRSLMRAKSDIDRNYSFKGSSTNDPCYDNMGRAAFNDISKYENYGRCQAEDRYCKTGGADPHKDSLTAGYQACVKELWALVGKERWNGVANISRRRNNGSFDRASRKSKKPPAPPQPLVQPVTPPTPPSGKSGGRHDYGTDIDDLDASDIEIMDVVEEEPKSKNRGKYCECRDGDIELHGLCSPDGVGLYEKGQYPWTPACKVTVGGRVNLREWFDNYNHNRR